MAGDFGGKSKAKKNNFKNKNKINKHKPDKKKTIFNSQNNEAKTAKKPTTPFDMDIVDKKIIQLNIEIEETNNKKARKKLRYLEFIKKKFMQIQNTENSLKMDQELCEEDTSENIDETIDIDTKEERLSDDSTSEASEDDTEMVKKDTMKGIKRFVVFVGNLPKATTVDDLKTHFAKVGSIKSVRIPESKESRKNGFGFIELDDRISFEKTLSMHHTMLNNRRINVLFTNPDGSNLDQKEIKKKNSKFDAMRKAGLLAGSVAQHKKRSFRRNKKRLAEAKAAASCPE